MAHPGRRSAPSRGSWRARAECSRPRRPRWRSSGWPVVVSFRFRPQRGSFDILTRMFMIERPRSRSPRGAARCVQEMWFPTGPSRPTYPITAWIWSVGAWIHPLEGSSLSVRRRSCGGTCRLHRRALLTLGGPGRDTAWLASSACSVRHRALVALHVDHVRHDWPDRRWSNPVWPTREISTSLRFGRCGAAAGTPLPSWCAVTTAAGPCAKRCGSPGRAHPSSSSPSRAGPPGYPGSSFGVSTSSSHASPNSWPSSSGTATATDVQR